MSKSKKTDKITVPAPKDSSTVKNGCISDAHYKLDAKAFPCDACNAWNYWSAATDINA